MPVTRGTVSKTSSTSSRPDESVLQTCNLDISSGHVVLVGHYRTMQSY